MSLPFLGHDGHDDASLPPSLGADLDQGLAVDPEVVARVRAAMTSEFRRRAAMTGAQPGAAPAHPAARSRWLPALRPLASFGLAGMLLLGSFGLVAANSGPGDPFYELRLAAEGLNPLGGPSAHLDRLEDRLDEARQAAGNGAAVSAALRAYRDELQRALDEAQDAESRRAVLAALDAHKAVLDALEQTVPDAAASGLDQARDQIGKAQQGLRGKDAAPVSSPSPDGTRPERTRRPAETNRPANK